MTASETLSQGILAYKDGRYLDAFQLCERAQDEATSAEQLEVSLYALHLWLAEICLQIGDFKKAQEFVDNASKCANKEIDDNVYNDFAGVADIASVQWRLLSLLGDHEEALEGIAKLVAQQKERYGVDSLHLANALNSQGVTLGEAGQAKEAEAPLRRAMSMRERLVGVDSVSFSESLNNLSVNYGMQNNFTLGEALGTRALSLRRKHLRANHPSIGHSLHNIGSQKLKHQDSKKAEENFLAALKIFEQELPPRHPQLSMTLSGLGTALVAQRKFKEARVPFERALSIAEETPAQKDLLLLSALSGLGLAHLGSLQFKEAEPYTKRALYMVEHSAQLKTASEKGLLDRLMVCYVFQGKLADALKFYPDSMRAKYTNTFESLFDLLSAVGEFAKKQLPPRENI
ncbi:MAG: tetratricopeptide repeat protein [Candidatus Obscuribacterales bacterium]|nr:tetratricopeptide repeat protein [Candidatus Obscuribacterales bacterium]